MSDVAPRRPIKLNTCRLCDRVRVVGKAEWMSEAEFHERYRDDARHIDGQVVRREAKYCDQHAADLNVNETYESGDTVYQDAPPEEGDQSSGLEDPQQ